MNIIFWDESFFRHSNNVQATKVLIQKWKLQVPLSNQEQKAMFLAASSSDVNIDFSCSFSVCSIGRTIFNWTRKIKFAQHCTYSISKTWLTQTSCISLFNHFCITWSYNSRRVIFTFNIQRYNLVILTQSSR